MIAVQGFHRQRRAERGGGHRDRQRAVQVIATPLEYLMRSLHDLKEQVTGRATARADLSLTGQLNVCAVLHPGRDRDLDGAASAYPAVAVAFGAGMGHQRAVATAARAWPRGHHLAEEGASHLAHLSAAATHLACLRMRTGGCSLTGTGRADHRGVDYKFTRCAEGALSEIELYPQRRVPAPARPAARSPGSGARTEESVHDVAEREACGKPAGTGAAGRERVGAEIIHLALVRVGEHLIGLGDLFEALLRMRIGIDIR